MKAGRKPISKPTKDDFLQMLNDTKSLRELSRQLGLSHTTLYEWMTDWKIKRVITYI